MGQGVAIGGREVTDLDDASGSIVDGVGAIASREASMALWWIGVDWDGGGGGAAEGAVAVRSAAEAEGDGDGDERPRVGRSW